MRYLGLAFFMILLQTISWSQGTPSMPQTLISLEGKNVPLGKKHIQVFVLLSPECPACIAYVPELNRIKSEFSPIADFYAFFPSESYSKSEIQQFCTAYSFSWNGFRDPDRSWVKYLQATITPEVIIYSGGSKVYRGRIDNSFYAVGKKRAKVTHHELQEVLEKLRNKQAITPFSTQAIGCILE